MNAIVVYESLWGNTAAIAHAIAEGLGPDTPAVTAESAAGEVLADADLIVAGAPVLGFALPTEKIRRSIGTNPQHAENPPDLSHPALRSWLDTLPRGDGRFAAFETRIWWSPRGATSGITKRFKQAGYREAVPAEPFIVTDTYGPLKDGEVERAREWGRMLASAIESGENRRPGR